jgi:hypothetical protein
LKPLLGLAAFITTTSLPRLLVDTCSRSRLLRRRIPKGFLPLRFHFLVELLGHFLAYLSIETLSPLLYCVEMDAPTEWSGEIVVLDGQALTAKFVRYRKTEYHWTTEADEEGLYYSYVRKYSTINGINVASYVKRASAKRSAIRRYHAHIRRNEKQRKRSKCNRCEERTKIPGDYLCGRCRYG